MLNSLNRPQLNRRPLWMLGFALLLLAGALLWRASYDALRPVLNPPPPAVIEESAASTATKLRAQLANAPDNPQLTAQLGLVLLQQVRETGDASLYNLAEQAFTQALALDANQIDALVGQGALALARHDFETALDWAERARAINPFRAAIVGIQVDALVELSRYEEAIVTAQEMVDLRPDLQSYSRVSYVRELHGDVDGAVEAMTAAVQAGGPGAEGTAWTTVQLGHLYFNQGDLRAAANTYRAAAQQRPGYAYAEAGLAKVEASRGRTRRAIERYEAIIERLPLPEFVIALGELYEARGDLDLARQQYALVDAMQQMNADAGMNVDMELALFNADRLSDGQMGLDAEQVVQQARAAYAARPTVYAADVLAWALYRAGHADEAWPYSQESLSLGTQDAQLHYHAGAIALARGDQEAAREHLQTVLEINPYFSELHAPQAKAMLASIQ